MTNYASMTERQFGEILRQTRGLAALNSLHLAITKQAEEVQIQLKMAAQSHRKRVMRGRLQRLSKLSADLVTLTHYADLALGRMQSRTRQTI